MQLICTKAENFKIILQYEPDRKIVGIPAGEPGG